MVFSGEAFDGRWNVCASTNFSTVSLIKKNSTLIYRESNSPSITFELVFFDYGQHKPNIEIYR